MTYFWVQNPSTVTLTLRESISPLGKNYFVLQQKETAKKFPLVNLYLKI